MEHTYTTKEVARIMGFSEHTITKAVRNKVLNPTDIVEGHGRHPYKYIFDEAGIKAYGEKIGVEPIFENSGKEYKQPETIMAVVEEPKEQATVLHEFYIIRLGEYYLSDSMKFDVMDKAKRFSVEGRETAREQTKSTGGKLVLIQTTAREV